MGEPGFAHIRSLMLLRQYSRTRLPNVVRIGACFEIRDGKLEDCGNFNASQLAQQTRGPSKPLTAIVRYHPLKTGT